MSSSLSSNLIDVLKTILTTQAVTSQAEIKQKLKTHGHIVNQSKISRLLRKIGAFKAVKDNVSTYALPQEPEPPKSKEVLLHLVSRITTNETSILIHTNPGCASLIGRLFDHHLQTLNILGTVAGDDTVLVVPKSIKKIAQTVELIKAFLLEK